MDQEDLELVRETIGAVLDGCTPAEVPAALLESGWQELVDDDGAGAVAALFEVQGRTRAASAALDLVALGALGLPIVSDVALVYPVVRHDDSFTAATRAPDGALVIDGLVLAGSERAESFLVPVHDDGNGPGEIMTIDAAALDRTPVGGFDPALALARASGRVDAGAVAVTEAKPSLAALAVACRVAVASELLGASEALLELTSEQVSSRPMFGRSLGSFQSVQHRVADMVVAIAALRETIGALGADPAPLGGQVVKAIAGRSALLVAKHAQQLCGGIGFTEEHALPGALRRVHALDAFLGSSRRLQVEIGAALLATGSVPRLFPV